MKQVDIGIEFVELLQIFLRDEHGYLQIFAHSDDGDLIVADIPGPSVRGTAGKQPQTQKDEKKFSHSAKTERKRLPAPRQTSKGFKGNFPRQRMPNPLPEPTRNFCGFLPVQICAGPGLDKIRRAQSPGFPRPWLP